MSAQVQRALTRLACAGAVLAPVGEGVFGVLPRGDRRRRPLAKIVATDVRALQAEGILEQHGSNGFTLSDAGRARLRREGALRDGALRDEAFLAQHAPLIARAAIDADGDVRAVRGIALSTVIARLAALRDASDKPWLTGAEIAAAQTLRADWQAAQSGLTRGSDWSAPPMGGGARGPGNVQERAQAARCDARRRLADALDGLAQPLRRVVERVCLREDGLEALERAEGWPARSGKLALKLGLAQLAQALGRR